MTGQQNPAMIGRKRGRYGQRQGKFRPSGLQMLKHGGLAERRCQNVLDLF
jgi:hypothetical protein